MVLARQVIERLLKAYFRYLNHEELVMEVQTLDDLKAQNAAEEAKAIPPETQEVPEEEPKAEVVEEKTEPDGEETETGAEDWLAEEKDSKADGQVPLAAHISMRTKLKGTLREQNSEIEKLRQEIESLKQVKAPPVKAAATTKVPERLDFETDAEYSAAMRDWMLQETTLANQTVLAKTRQQEEIKARDEAVEAHYRRAEKLLSDHSISEDLYKNADLKVRQAFEAVVPGGGDLVVDSIIERLGEGSEKVMYFLGRNEDARAKLINKLMTDKTGLSASIYLGELKAQKANAQSNSSSRAPAPASKVKGSNKTSATVENMKREYLAAQKSGDVQKAIDLKFEAKKSGFNTKEW